jgi:hypothetical protein
MDENTIKLDDISQEEFFKQNLRNLKKRNLRIRSHKKKGDPEHKMLMSKLKKL